MHIDGVRGGRILRRQDGCQLGELVSHVIHIFGEGKAAAERLLELICVKMLTVWLGMSELRMRTSNQDAVYGILLDNSTREWKI